MKGLQDADVELGLLHVPLELPLDAQVGLGVIAVHAELGLGLGLLGTSECLGEGRAPLLGDLVG